MDPTRFDDLARIASQPQSRRGLLSVLLGGALGSAALSPISAGATHRRHATSPNRKKPKKKCSKGKTRCGGTCVDLNRDPQNCGGCNNACGAVRTCCTGACIDTNADPTNCGACGHLCAENEQCLNGTCQRCPPGESVCTDATGFQFCADLSSDQNCGACGRACPQDETCQAGGGGVGVACVCPGDRCPVGDGTTNCCPVAGGTCCAGGGCCPPSQSQCNSDGTCCGADETWCGPGTNQCCPAGTSCGGDCGAPCC